MIYNLQLLKRPYPFQTGTITLWSNKYIAQNVINRHLDGNVDSGSRKFITINKTVEWIKQIKPDAKQVLDIGCGPGLYAPLFCKFGIHYEGLDVSPYQIDYAKNNNEIQGKTEFRVGDFRTSEFNKKYDLVLLMYGIYSFYKKEERVNFLKKIKANLNKGGSIIIEVFTGRHYQGRAETSDWLYIEKDGFWCKTPHLELNSFYRYDEESLVLIQVGVLNSTLNIWNSWIQIFELKQLEIELLESGFEKFEVFGNCFGGKFTSESDTICILAY